MLAHKNFIPLSMSVTDVLGEVSFVLTETLHDQKKTTLQIGPKLMHGRTVFLAGCIFASFLVIFCEFWEACRIQNKKCTLPKTNMRMEKQTFEDVSPIKNYDFPSPC